MQDADIQVRRLHMRLRRTGARLRGSLRGLWRRGKERFRGAKVLMGMRMIILREAVEMAFIKMDSLYVEMRSR